MRLRPKNVPLEPAVPVPATFALANVRFEGKMRRSALLAESTKHGKVDMAVQALVNQITLLTQDNDARSGRVSKNGVWSIQSRCHRRTAISGCATRHTDPVACDSRYRPCYVNPADSAVEIVARGKAAKSVAADACMEE